MATATLPRTRKKPFRSIRLVSRPGPGRVGTVAITVGGKEETYWLEALASDYGRAFQLTKWTEGADSYAVCIDQQEGHHSCECKGFLRHQHCKHTEGLFALLGYRS
jgi:hypothetical protein